MGLTSKKVLLLAVIAAVVLFAVTVWLWPRLAKRSIPAVLGRIGMLLFTQFSMIAALGLAANYSFGFYASWADLFGQESQPGVVVNHAGGAANQLQVIDNLYVNVPGGSVPRVGGQIQKVEFQGGASKIATPAYVYLPPEYFQDAKRAFPASVILTGYPGTAEALFKKMKYPSIANQQVKDHKAKPTILIMMRPTVAPPRDTECMDIPGGPQTETFFTKDLRAAMSSRYRIGGNARNWGIMGDSTGGYCALKFAMRHPDAYSTAVGLSPYYKAPHDPTTGDLFGGDKTLERQNNLSWRFKNLPHPSVNLLVTSSKQGEPNYQETLKFIDAAKAPTKMSSIILDSGGHNFNTWAREIPPALEWLSGRLSDQ
ncbi:alpha/beta hydrolase-fold protein [Streptomyces sp. H10-C2]|uniref:alpha/beta hydrolase n=1 Tax=unclassified Streptomyces TaxID=2593676 RepID=UPI0024BBC828|nr:MULTISPECIES: alpha/beta hydrolase-fold protein [unclassified Streptomyces]MDJ0343979.1 alpha/beta hydrolase-fold protein [Streptomyces sp. PH10-H1]MDJ0373530.1 alpha/beta hydrolase-fold protein [Streptomyces sp. H10-C2]